MSPRTNEDDPRHSPLFDSGMLQPELVQVEIHLISLQALQHQDLVFKVRK